MKRSEVRALIKSAVDALSQSIKFNSGRITEFNSEPDKPYPYIWLEPLSVTTEPNSSQAPFDTWSCVIHVAKKDSHDSKPEEYEEIVDECDLIAQKLIQKVNQVVDGYKLITLSGLSREPFIHKHADDISGVIVSFNLSLLDKTNVC